MLALLSLMEIMETLMKVAQGRDIYIVDFVSALTTCISNFIEMYEDCCTSYTTSEFWSLKQLLQFDHESIHLQWLEDDQNCDALLAFVFVCDKQLIFARQNGEKVNPAMWVETVAKVKQDVRQAALKLKLELAKR